MSNSTSDPTYDSTPNPIETIQQKAYLCRHLFTDGRRCGSRALRHEHFCYYHHTTRHPAPKKPINWCGIHSEFELTLCEDRSAIQHNIGEILRRIAQNQIDPKRAGLLLYGLQIAAMNLPKEDRTTTRATGNGRYMTRPNPRNNSSYNTPNNNPIEDIIHDETYGPIAPQTAFDEDNEERPSVALQLLRKLERRTLCTHPDHKGHHDQDYLPGHDLDDASGHDPEPKPTTLPTLQAVAEEPTTTALNKQPPIRVPISPGPKITGCRYLRVPHPFAASPRKGGRTPSPKPPQNPPIPRKSKPNPLFRPTLPTSRGRGDT
jgi:hypothetical protein